MKRLWHTALNLVYAPWIIATALLMTAVGLERYEQRVWWCDCGGTNLWVRDIWSSHCSQHLFDPYSFTHLLHGLLFYGIIVLLFRRLSFQWQFTLMILAESAWEVVENSKFVVHRYREATIGLGYEGDSIANSMSDILCCAIGFVLARYLGFKRSLILFVIVEIILLIWIRDNLTLNIIMLVHPINAIKSWQMGN